MGTANFICPENYLGHGYDFKADVWALGSLAFELFVGIPIMNFFDPTKVDLDEKFIDGMLYVPKLESITLEFIDFLSKCLQFEPKNRPTMSEIRDHPFLNQPVTE